MSHQAMNLPEHDRLAQLAREDPEAFDALCRDVIDDTIDHAPERIQVRLRGLQFRIDGIRRLSRSPLGATVKIYALMWDSFLQMNHKLQDLVAPADAHCANKITQQMPVRDAKIVQFQRRAAAPTEPSTKMDVPGSVTSARRISEPEAEHVPS